MNTYKFHVNGTHCASCKILIEDVLGEQPEVQKVNVDLKKKIVTIDIESDDAPEKIVRDLSVKIAPNGYKLTLEQQNQTETKDEIIWKALPIGLLFLVLFFALQKSGILNIGLGGKVTAPTGFLIGLIASVSSCLAVVGGLVLSISAKVSEDNVSDTLGHRPTGETRTFVLFHSGRLVSFAFLGGALGALGGAIGINFTLTAVLGLIASLVMLMLGLNLLGLMKHSKITLPADVFNFFRKVEHQTWTPLLVGFATFFLPCGFTQSMQIAALSSGSFIGGASLMFAFALGTLPVLALLSFGSASFAQSKHAPLFFKTAGVVVTGLGIFALLGGLAGLGIIQPLFNI